jgi:hypothetical protein
MKARESGMPGVIPTDSPWGREYARRAAAGHPVYSLACFRSVPETVALAKRAGFALRQVASTLFWKPGGTPDCETRIEHGVVARAGFAALRFESPGTMPGLESSL